MCQCSSDTSTTSHELGFLYKPIHRSLILPLPCPWLLGQPCTRLGSHAPFNLPAHQVFISLDSQTLISRPRALLFFLCHIQPPQSIHCSSSPSTICAIHEASRLYPSCLDLVNHLFPLLSLLDLSSILSHLLISAPPDLCPALPTLSSSHMPRPCSLSSVIPPL